MTIHLIIGSVVFLLSSTSDADAQSRRVRAAMPGYTIAGLSFLTAKLSGYYGAEGLDAELIAMRAPKANLALVSGSVEFSTVPLLGLTTALRGGALKVLLVHFDKPQHALFAKSELQNIRALRGKKIAVAGPAVIDEPTATKVYDSSRPTMTADGALSDDAQKKMAAFVAQTSSLKEISPMEKAFDFSFVRKAHAALQVKDWQPGS